MTNAGGTKERKEHLFTDYGRQINIVILEISLNSSQKIKTSTTYDQGMSLLIISKRTLYLTIETFALYAYGYFIHYNKGLESASLSINH